MSYIEDYKKSVATFESERKRLMDKVVSLLKKYGKPLVLGNGEYWYVVENGIEVPAYKDEMYGRFMPMYDKDCTCDFGWSDFTQCCHIFDAIDRKLTK